MDFLQNPGPRSLQSTVGFAISASNHSNSEAPTQRRNNKLLEIIDIKSIHDTHVWSLDGSYHILTTRIVVDELFDLNKSKAIKHEIKTVTAKFDIKHSSIEIEKNGECNDTE